MTDYSNDFYQAERPVNFTWQEDWEIVRRRLLGALIEHSVDVSELVWLSGEESESVVRHWVDIGAERYGRLALIAPPWAGVLRGEYGGGVIPSWLDGRPREVFVMFFQDYHKKFVARCGWKFVLDNITVLARADGDGFAALTSELEGVLLVNVEDELGDSVLEIEAWGDLVATAR
jgi:hypothetical protein